MKHKNMSQNYINSVTIGIVPPGKLHFWESGVSFKLDIQSGRQYKGEWDRDGDGFELPSVGFHPPRGFTV